LTQFPEFEISTSTLRKEVVMIYDSCSEVAEF